MNMPRFNKILRVYTYTSTPYRQIDPYEIRFYILLDINNGTRQITTFSPPLNNATFLSAISALKLQRPSSPLISFRFQSSAASIRVCKTVFSRSRTSAYTKKIVFTYLLLSFILSVHCALRLWLYRRQSFYVLFTHLVPSCRQITLYKIYNQE